MKKKMKFRNLCLLVVLLCVPTFSGCAAFPEQEDVVSEDAILQEDDTYSEGELEFIKEYQKLKEGNVKIEEVALPSDNPKDTDFAVVPLEETFFQVPAFSFLPIDHRNLTSLELMQLYHCYGDLEAEKILESIASVQSDGERTANRELSNGEQFLLKYDVLEQYFNQKKRPVEKLSTDEKSANPFYKMLSETERFWFYPTEQLTEEQLLQITDSLYSEVPEEWYTPNEEELSVEDIEQEVQHKMKEYLLTNKKAEKIYTFYTSAIPMNAVIPEGMQNFKNCYEISVNMKHSPYDYTLTLSANDGSLIKWKRYPKNFFSKESYNADRQTLDTLNAKEDDTIVTEEELKNIAINYAEKVLVPKEELVSNKILVEEESNPDLNYRKVTIYSSNIEYGIFINKEDKEVCGLEVR